MAKTIELTKVVVKKIVIDPVSQTMFIDYNLTTEDGRVYHSGRGSAFVTWPKDDKGVPLVGEGDWFQLTQNEISAAVQLLATANAALAQRLNNGQL